MFDVNYGYNYIKILDCLSIFALKFRWSLLGKKLTQHTKSV